jgi:hypothetical protein
MNGAFDGVLDVPSLGGDFTRLAAQDPPTWVMTRSSLAATLRTVLGDSFLAAIDDIAAALEAAREALDGSTEPLASARRRRLAGASMLEIVDELVAAGGPEARRDTARAFARYERAVKTFRGTVIRTLVDEEGVSLSEVSRRLSISRQMTTRLYQAVGGDTST